MHMEVMPASPRMGGGGRLDPVGDFLLDGAPHLGAGVQRIDVTMLLQGRPRAPRRSSDVPPPTEPGAAADDQGDAVIGIGPGHSGLEQEHEERRTRGGAITFRRASRRVELRVVSEVSEWDAFGPEELTPTVFAVAAREIVAGLADLERRVKPSDDFDGAGFRAHLQTRLKALPRTQEEVASVVTLLEEAAARRWAEAGKWELVDVDWEVFAPGTRERFDDPFFFDPADDEAPHGSDAGADLLSDYLTRRPSDGWEFLQAQLREAGVDSTEGLAEEDVVEQDTLVIAAVFAELMVQGHASDQLLQAGLQALSRRDALAPSPRNDQLRRALARPPGGARGARPAAG